MKALIIDDDPASHKVLGNLIAEEHPDIKLLASGFGIEEGLGMIERHHPELVFLDIELPDGLGFDLIQKVSQPNFQVIFITAHSKYAISAIQFGALDFLVKPIGRSELATSLEKAKRNFKRPISNDQLQILIEAYERGPLQKLPSRLAISNQHDTVFLKVEDIVYLEANTVYTIFNLKNGQQVISSINLGKYILQFQPYREFIQVHRSFMINLHYVERYIKGDRLIIMAGGAQIKLSRGYWEDFMRGMEEV